MRSICYNHSRTRKGAPACPRKSVPAGFILGSSTPYHDRTKRKNIMKKRFAAYLREKDSLQELVISATDKPAVDPAFAQRWQKKINLLAMEGGKSQALLLQIRQGSIGVLLKSDRWDQPDIEHTVANGLYCVTGMGNQGLLVANSASAEAQDGSPSGMALVTTCFGLPIQWPDKVLFGVLCVLNYPGKALKPVYRDILSELRETIEEELAQMLERQQSPMPARTEAPAPVETAPAIPEAAIPPDQEQQAQQPPKAEVPAAAAMPVAEPALVSVKPPVPTPQHSDTDALTSIYGRKKIEDILKHEFERAKRYFKTFSVTMIDLNGLHAINDSLGQEAGDNVLKAFAVSVGSKIRETDSWGRWGGDAFILVCPYADTVETQQMFTRIKPLVTRDMKAVEGYSDFSFGVSQYEPEDLTYQAIVNRAEENMDQYKEMGKRKAFAEADGRNASGR
jgi:diguanylate cyclase (GGDEF)-like protein